MFNNLLDQVPQNVGIEAFLQFSEVFPKVDRKTMLSSLEDFLEHACVCRDALINTHPETAKHDSNQAVDIGIHLKDYGMYTYPPVLVPPMRSNNSQGFIGRRP